MNTIRILPEQIREKGIPMNDLPEEPPRREGHALFAIIAKDGGEEFVVAADDPYCYHTYRRTTWHPGDQGNRFFEKMNLFFVPVGALDSSAGKEVTIV